MSQRRRFAREHMDAWVKERGVILIDVDLDESPMVYRRLPEVLAEAFRHNQNPAYAACPLAVAMAGKSVVDPWRD